MNIFKRRISLILSVVMLATAILPIIVVNAASTVNYELTLDGIMDVINEFSNNNEELQMTISMYMSLIKEFKISYNVTNEKVEGEAIVDINMPDMLEVNATSNATSTYNSNLQISTPNTKGAYEGKLSEMQ